MNTRSPRLRTLSLFRLFVWLLFGLAGGVSAQAELDTLQLDGHEVHATRLLARLRPEALKADLALASGTPSASVAAAQGLAEERPFALLPDWVLLDEASASPGRTAASTAGGASAAGPAATPNSSDYAPAVRVLRLKERIAALRASGRYEYVEPDYIVRTQAIPGDGAFVDGTLWGLRNTGQSGGVAGADIDAVRAWDLSTGSSTVIVGVIDSGIRYTHRDLAARMWRNPGESGAGRENNGVDDDGDGYVDNVFGINAILRNGNPMDDNDHGTHCAGTIGAAANDGNRHVGVAWDVRLMALKFLSADGSGSNSDAIRCIDFAVSKGVRILSNSWGGGGNSQALRASIVAARNQGVLFIAAAGNDSANNDVTPSYPANYDIDNVISVAAIDRQDKLASFSNYGQGTVHLGAPGVMIYSTGSGSDTEYKTFSGTSMATPHVAGAAALLLARFPGITLPDLRTRLLNTVVGTPALLGRTITGGRLNAYQALNTVPDGILEIEASSSTGIEIAGGAPVVLTVRVSDLAGVTNATVTGRLGPDGAAVVSMANNGVAPDLVAGDFLYTASFTPPTTAGPITFRVTAAAPGKTSATRDFVFTIVVRPPNDEFANSVVLPSAGGTVSGTNRLATKQAGEPAHAGISGGASVWWTWTAPQAGNAIVRTAGSTFDTLLAVYRGTAVNALTFVAGNDDVGGTLQSEVGFAVTAGQVYRIAVDGYGAATGAITLSVQLAGASPPANDAFASATVLAGASLVATGTNLSATKELGEPSHAGNTGGRSVWWRWTAPAAGQVALAADASGFDTLLAVYTGDNVVGLLTVAADDDSGAGTTSALSFNATAGTTYRIAIDGKNGAAGAISFALTLSTSQPAPTNDAFAARATLFGTTPTAQGNNIGATKETGEPVHAGNSGGRSVWWTWTAPSTGRATLNTLGSDFDTLLAVYSGETVSTLTQIAANDQSPAGGVTSSLSFDTIAGLRYQIAVDGANFGFGAASGEVRLALTLNTQTGPPPNDNFASATVLTGLAATASGRNTGATEEIGEPVHVSRGGGRSVWWSWTAPETGFVTVLTAGSDFDTVLAIYGGSSVSSLVLLGADDDGGVGATSRIAFNARAGITYRFAVDGFEDATGNIVISLSYGASTSPPNDAFVNRIVLSGTKATDIGTNLDATTDPGEPAHLLGDRSYRSVWWSWTSPGTGTVRISTEGSDFDTVLAIYTGSTIPTLLRVTGNDDAANRDDFTSEVSFTATAGITYQIAVDGFESASGVVVLEVDYTGPIRPVFSRQPASVTVAPGEATSFSVAASGFPSPTWQWQRSTNGGATWGNVTNTAPYSGTTTSTLRISAAPASAQGHLFRVRATNLAGSVISEPAALVIGVLFTDFQTQHFSAAERTQPTLAGPAADPDADGLPNLLEYALGSDPRASDSAAAPEVGRDETGALTLTYLRRTDVAGVGYVVEFASDLAGPWLSDAASVEEISVIPLGGSRVRVTARASTVHDRSFLRLRIDLR